MKHALLCDIFAAIPDLELAILVGSRATNKARPDSDWDIAIQWDRSLGFVEQLAATERLRKELSGILGIAVSSVDLIDVPTARLAMRAVVAEEGVVIKGADSIAWYRFLQRTWRELEEHYWEETYAA